MDNMYDKSARKSLYQSMIVNPEDTKKNSNTFSDIGLKSTLISKQEYEKNKKQRATNLLCPVDIFD